MRTQSSRTTLVVSFVVLLAVSAPRPDPVRELHRNHHQQGRQPSPDVEVVATNPATQVTYKARSNDRGLYTISALPIGTYKIRAQAPSFQAFETNPIRLESGQNARVDITMQLGADARTSRSSASQPHPPDAERGGGRGHLRRRPSRACRSTGATSPSSRCCCPAS